MSLDSNQDQVSYFQEVAQMTISVLEHLKINGVEDQFSFFIQCGELTDYLNIPIQFSEKYEELFNKLSELNGPLVYWIENTSDASSANVLETFRKYKATEGCRATPALKSLARINMDSNILYVGKVKNNFVGRLITHLGFNKWAATQGLQLFHWAKSIELNLHVRLLKFAPEMTDILPILEVALAKKMAPLIDKHK